MIALEDKTYGVVAVCIPIAVLVRFCRFTLNDKVALVLFINSSDDVQKGGFSAPRSAENGNKFIPAEFDAYAFQCGDRAAGYRIILFNVNKFKHFENLLKYQAYHYMQVIEPL